MGDYYDIGEYVGLRVWGLNSLKGRYIGDDIGDYYRGYKGGYQEV